MTLGIKSNDSHHLHFLNMTARHIIRLRDTFQYDDDLCLVFDRLPISVAQHLESRGFTLSEIQSIAMQLLEATEYMHEQGIIHSDIKPANIMLENDRATTNNIHKIRIIDFGTSVRVHVNYTTLITSPPYKSPEALIGKDRGSFPVDLWSIGCVLYELYTRQQLFDIYKKETL
jgi:serine/threonine protein kinase